MARAFGVGVTCLLGGMYALSAGIFLASCGKADEPAPEPKKVERPAPKLPSTQAAPIKIGDPDPLLVTRGKYLVDDVMACSGCHTPPSANGGPDMSRYMAGGFDFPDVFGTWRAPNITPDNKTGIGAWTDAQLAAAIREGKRPNGEQMYSVMPFLRFNVLSDDDTAAVVAYLRTVPPVENVVKPNTDLKLTKPPAPKPTGKPPGDDPLKKGEYLITIMQCLECHSPSTDQGPDLTRAYSGGMKFDLPPFMGSGTVWSANITSDLDTGIGKYTEDQIVNAITHLQKADGSIIMGPMMFIAPYWSGMKHDDLVAAAKYVKSIPPVKNQVPKSTARPPGDAPATSPAK